MDNVKIISSFHKASRSAFKVDGREMNAFIIRIKGCGKYIFGDKTICVNEGEMIFVPKGATYSFITPPQSENLYTSINFTSENVDIPTKVYSLSDFYNVKYITESFPELWNFGDESDRYKCYALFYELISHVKRSELLSDAQKRKNAVIEPAVEYMKRNMYKGDFRIEKLSLLCGVSDTYFRKLFVERFNMTPNDYVTAGRLSYAKAIIENGDFDSIKEVAYLVGYNDPLYFGKAFKKFYGYPPSVSNRK